MSLIPDRDKKRLAAFIDFRFKEVKKENQDYTLEQFIRGICSEMTYDDMMHGRDVDEQIYRSFLQKMGYTYNDDEASVHTFMADEAEILYLLDQQDMKTFSSAVKMLLEMMESYRNCALESMTYDCLQTVLNIQLNHYEYQFLMERFSILDKYAKEICGYFLLDYIYHNIADDVNEKWLKEKGLLTLKGVGSEYNILNLLIRHEKYYNASVYCDHLLQECIQKEYDVMAFHIKIKRMYIIMKIQNDSFISYADKVYADTVMRNGKDETYMYEFNHVVGLYYYIEKNYDLAWMYFIRTIYESDYYFPEIIFLNHIATIQNKELPEILKKEIPVNKENEVYEPIYTYFCLKNYHETPQALENYLWDRCIRHLNDFYPEWVMKEIIWDELQWIASKTGNKERLKTFAEVVEGLR